MWELDIIKGNIKWLLLNSNEEPRECKLVQFIKKKKSRRKEKKTYERCNQQC